MVTPNQKQKEAIKAKKESLSLVKMKYDAMHESLNSYILSIIDGSDAESDKEWVLDEDLNIKEKEVDLD